MDNTNQRPRRPRPRLTAAQTIAMQTTQVTTILARREGGDPTYGIIEGCDIAELVVWNALIGVWEASQD
jgi:predicted amidohydrolase YtcJ